MTTCSLPVLRVWRVFYTFFTGCLRAQRVLCVFYVLFVCSTPSWRVLCVPRVLCVLFSCSACFCVFYVLFECSTCYLRVLPAKTHGYWNVKSIRACKRGESSKDDAELRGDARTPQAARTGRDEVAFCTIAYTMGVPMPYSKNNVKGVIMYSPLTSLTPAKSANTCLYETAQ